MEIYLPSLVITKIDQIDFGKDYNTKQINKIKKILYSFWIYIYHRNIEIEENFYVNIFSKDLIKKFCLKLNYKHLNYNYFLELLESVNLIDINNKYSVGEFSKSYRVNTSALNSYYEKVLIKNNLFDDAKPQEYWIKKYPRHQLLIKNYYSISIDIDAYWKYLWDNKGMYLKTETKYKTELGFPITQSVYLTPDKIYRYINTALKINFKNYWFKEADSGRLYSTFTSLPSTAHCFIYSNNKRLYEVDIKNCQPLLLASLVKSKKYKKAVEDGQFYEDVMDAYPTKMDRASIKTELYKRVFFANNELKSGKMYETLQKLYPGLISEINKIVEHNSIHLSAILQEKEAKIFLDDIERSAPKKFYVTKHDAVFVYEEDVKFMVRIIKQIFLIDYNLNVTTKTNLN